jgi:ketosteroid isomerase-like protein
VNHPNHDLIKRAYEALGRSDIPTVLGTLDKQIRWHVPGQSLLSNVYIGHEQVLGFFQKSMELSQRTLRIDVHDIAASDTTVFVLCTVSATRSGQRAQFLEVHLWRIADGRAIDYAGGLLSYGPDLSMLFHRRASLIDQILKGANAGDLPIGEPTDFELDANLTAAGKLNVSIPVSILSRATRVVE